MAKHANMIGRTFGKLTVCEFVKTTNKEIDLFKCQCTCGNISIVQKPNLSSGHSKSCGCNRGRKLKDISGQTFGRLTAIKRIGKRGKESLWQTKCVCGNFHLVTLSNLQQGNVTSCGCRFYDRTTNVGELTDGYVKKILTRNSILNRQDITDEIVELNRLIIKAKEVIKHEKDGH